MSNDASQIVVGANGTISVAPVGSPLPTDVASPLDGAFAELGFTDDSGVKFTDARTYNPVPAWQSLYPIAQLLQSKESTLAFVLRQWNSANVLLGFGGGAIDGIGGGARNTVAIALTGFSGTDSFHLTYAAAESAVITRGTNYTAAGIKAAFEGIAGVDFAVTVSDVSDNGFIIEWDAVGTATAITVTNTSGVTATVQVLVAGADDTGTSSVYTPPLPEDGVDYRSLVVEWEGGDGFTYRVVVPRGMAGGSIETDLVRAAPADLPVSFMVMPSDSPTEGDLSTQPWYMVTDNSNITE